MTNKPLPPPPVKPTPAKTTSQAAFIPAEGSTPDNTPARVSRITAEQYYMRSLKHYDEGDLENALLDISEAIYLDPRFGPYYSTRGMYYITRGEVTGAAADFAYALKMSRRDWLAHYGMGILKYKEGYMAEALLAFDTALKFKPRRPEIWYYRAAAAFYNNDFERASESIEKALMYFPANDKRTREAKLWKKEIDGKLPKKERTRETDTTNPRPPRTPPKPIRGKS
ncbi:MAG TPA: tetratricopeptide repeat protein [Aggregatilineales bacterium]|nr:tetratricopeptide repeat protein [Anaerolineales bacterium]HRE47010.1 tetratricopeptide repeat protein [Aggregatilineales bacterium]